MEPETRNRIIIENLRLVEKLAKAKKKSIASPRVSYEDLLSAGYPALIEATERYNENEGAFEPYASKRIVGAMSDYAHEILRWGRRNTNRKTENSGKCLPQGKTMSSINDLPYDCQALMYFENELFDKITQDLPESGRTLLRWRYVDGLTNKQIGERLGVVESRVAQIVRKYKDKLRAIYQM